MSSAPSGPISTTQLARPIGRWSLAALAVNCVIGSSVFGLPSQVAGLLGRHSPWGVLLAGLMVGVIMACLAEVASYFTEAGGPYLYARDAFGPLIGIQTGWMLWLVQTTAPAANANLFVIYLAQFWPRATAPLTRFLTLTLLVGLLALLNCRGVRAGVQVSNLFTVAKIVPLAVIIVVGLAYLAAGHATPTQALPTGSRAAWVKALQMLFFFYGGFEAALTPMGEARNPRRDSAFALLVALLACMAIYTLVQWVVIAVLPHPSASVRPLADVAQIILGRAGAAFIAGSALLTLYGYLSAKTLTIPRITFALAEHGDFPAFFGALHPRFRTPYVSIVVFAGITWLLAIFGSFAWNVTLSAIARLFYYAVCCAALLRLRRKRPGQAHVRVPAGPLLAVVGMLMCLALATQVDFSNRLILAATVAVALGNWVWIRGRKAAVPQTP